VDDLERSERQLVDELQRARDSGEETLSRFLLEHLAVNECWSGRIDAALAHAREAAAGAVDEPGTPQLVSAVGSLALAEAYAGDIERVRELCGHGVAVASHAASIQFHAALGLAELSIPDYPAAYAHLRAALEAFERFGFGEPGVYRFHSDAAEAAAAVGDLDTAERVAEFLQSHGRRTNRRSSLATGARARGLVAAARGDVDEALAAVQGAMGWHENLPLPFERARTLLVKGVIERRLRQRGQAKASFQQALACFDEVGARQWAARARFELGRTGLRRVTANELTESERRVAELTARGLTRRQVAAELYVSPKTVDATLVRVYRKLGVRSRAEFGARMAERLQT
jgi:DNA-binding NarL/FixJ family response regulator